MNRCYDEAMLGRKPEINLIDAFKKYYIEYASHLKSNKTIAYQVRNLSRFFEKTIALHQVDDNMLNKYVVHRRGQPIKGKTDTSGNPAYVSPSTINRELSAFRKMYYLAKDKWKVRVAECDIKTHYLSEPDQHQEYLSETEQAALIECAPDHLKNPIRFALITGVRRANVIGLRWEDIKNGEITFRIKSQLPEGKILTLPIVDELKEIFAEELERNPEHTGYIFRNREGEVLGDFRKSLYTAFKKAGIKRKSGHGFHLLRHSSATTKLKNGTDITVIQKLLGHHDIATTMRYAHVKKSDIANAMEKHSTARNQHGEGKKHDDK